MKNCFKMYFCQKRFRISRRLSAFFVLFSLIFSLTGCSVFSTVFSKEETVPVTSIPKLLTFEEYTQQLFASEATSNTLSLHYSITNPASYHITAGEPTLGRFSSSLLKEMPVHTEAARNMLHSFSYDTLTKEEQLTYDILQSVFDLTLSAKGMELYHEQLGPTTGIQAQLPLLLAEYRLETAEDIETYLALLPCVYTYFSDLALYERERAAAGLFLCDTAIDRIIAQCESFIQNPEENFLITYFNEKISSIPTLSATARAQYQSENIKHIFQYIIPAYELLIDTLTELKGSGTGEYGLCYTPLGREYYEYLVATNTGSSKTIPELTEQLSSLLSEQLDTMQTLILESPSIYTDYLTFRYPVSEPAETLTYLQTAIADTFPAPADTVCEIKYVHPSLEEYVSPAMYFVPPIDSYIKNCIYINRNPSYDLSRIFSTLAHEGYPGHLYQHTYFLSTNPEPLRCLLNFSGYDEGWAIYAESLSYSLAGLSKPLATFLQANLLSTLCLYSLTDIQIHYNGYTKEDTILMLMEYGFSEETAEEIFYTVLIEPGMYHPYAIGYMELMELKELYRSLRDDAYTDLDFHTFMLETGPAPFEILKKYMYETKEVS